MKEIKLSPSALSLYDDCERCFWIKYNKKAKLPRGIFSSMPMGIDKLLKNYFDSHREKGTLPVELNGLDVKLFEDRTLLDRWRNNFRGIRFTDENNNTLFGAVDDIVVHENRLVVVDYKTRGFPLKIDTHERPTKQLAIYTYLLQKEGFQTEDFGYLLYWHPNLDQKVIDGKKETILSKSPYHIQSSEMQLLFHAEVVKVALDLDEVVQRFNGAINILKEEMPKSSETCSQCEYVNNMANLLGLS